MRVMEQRYAHHLYGYVPRLAAASFSMSVAVTTSKANCNDGQELNDDDDHVEDMTLPNAMPVVCSPCAPTYQPPVPLPVSRPRSAFQRCKAASNLCFIVLYSVFFFSSSFAQLYDEPITQCSKCKKPFSNVNVFQIHNFFKLSSPTMNSGLEMVQIRNFPGKMCFGLL